MSEKPNRNNFNKPESNITNLDKKRNEKINKSSFIKNEKGKILVRLHNTQIILNMLEIEIHYDVIKKRAFMKSPNNHIFNGCLSDYTITKLVDFASEQKYNIGRVTLTDHVHALAMDNSINKVADFFDQARKKWDGKSRIEEVFNTLPTKTVRWYALAVFKKWCINAVKLAFNTKGELNQEYILVLQGGQGAGKTTWFKSLLPIESDYFKEGLDLNPSDKDSVLECISHYLVELGELDATMKHEQAKLKAFITRSWDEVRKPYGKSSERTPRQTVLCATVNEEQFLKDKTGNRRYCIIKINDDEQCQLLDHIDLEQFWGEIAHLVFEGADHKLNAEEKKQQMIENNDFEMLSDAEIRIETGFQWGADKAHWRKVSTANICEVLGLSAKSKIVAQTLKKKGCEYHDERPRSWTVPPFTADHSDRRYTSIYV
jgi:putative DNA primase/helicase